MGEEDLTAEDEMNIDQSEASFDNKAVQMVIADPEQREWFGEIIRLHPTTKNFMRKSDVSSAVVAAALEQAAVSQAEWETGTVMLAEGRRFMAGDIEVLKWMVAGELVESGYLRVWLSPTASIRLAPGEYTGTAPNITITDLPGIDQSQMLTHATACAAGVLTLASGPG